MIKDARSKAKDERVRAFPLVSPDDTYDVKKYLELLLKATEELLIHLGYDAKHLRKILNIPPFVKGRTGGISEGTVLRR